VCTWPEGSLAADRLALAVGGSGSVGRVGHSHADLYCAALKSDCRI
jgi:hypothetical protein